MLQRLRAVGVALAVVLGAAACASPGPAAPTATPAALPALPGSSPQRTAGPAVSTRPPSGTPASATPIGDLPETPPPASPSPTSTVDPNATLIVLNPCSLITRGEAASALGGPVSRPLRAGGGCIYVDTASQRHVVTAFAVPAAEAADTVEGHLYLLGAFGVPFTTGDAAHLDDLTLSGDLNGVIAGLLALTQGAASLHIEKLDGLGDTGLWVSKEQGMVRQGFALIARGQTLLGVDLVVTSTRDSASMRDTASQLAERMLDRLPEQFTVIIERPSPTPPIGLTVIPAGSLSATAAGSPVPSATVPASPAASQAPSAAPEVEPPAFSQPVLSGRQLVYGGDCGTRLITMTVKIIDPSGLHGIESAQVMVRLVESAVGGTATSWTPLPMRDEGGDTWSRTIFSETDIPGYNTFPSAVVEYYFVAANGLGLNGESPRRGFDLVACPPATP